MAEPKVAQGIKAIPSKMDGTVGKEVGSSESSGLQV